jgi:hypothetical protein
MTSDARSFFSAFDGAVSTIATGPYQKTATAKHSQVGNQEHDGTDCCDEKAIAIQTRCLTLTQQIRQKTAEDSSDNTQENIPNQTVTRFVSNLAANESD